MDKPAQTYEGVPSIVTTSVDNNVTTAFPPKNEEKQLSADPGSTSENRQYHLHSPQERMEQEEMRSVPVTVSDVIRTAESTVKSQTTSETSTNVTTVTKQSHISKYMKNRDRDKEKQKRNSANILEQFEKQAKTYQSQQLQLSRQDRAKHKKPRSPSPGVSRQSVGLDHLDNLVRLMEQLTQLRDENSHLKKRCAFLEDAKDLLQAKSSMNNSPEGMLDTYSKSLPTKSKVKNEQALLTNQHSTRPRLPSAEDVQFIEICDETQDQTGEEEHDLEAAQVRSFSTGSINVTEKGPEVSPHHAIQNGIYKAIDISQEDSNFSNIGNIKPKKVSKWAKVKKVLTRQRLSEDSILHGPRPQKETLRSMSSAPLPLPEPEPPPHTGSVTAIGGAIPGEKEWLMAPHVGLTESRSVDSGVGSGLENTEGLRLSTSSCEPPSPLSSNLISSVAEDPEEDQCTEIWMGPPGWEDEGRHIVRRGSVTSGKSEKTNVTNSSKGTSGKGEIGDGAYGYGSSSSDLLTSDSVRLIHRTTSEKAGEIERSRQFLDVHSTRSSSVPRRSSSPSIARMQQSNDGTLLCVGDDSLRRKGSSKSDSKVAKKQCKKEEFIYFTTPVSRTDKKSYKISWGKMKDMIYMRRDSLKKRPKKSEKSGVDIQLEISDKDGSIEIPDHTGVSSQLAHSAEKARAGEKEGKGSHRKAKASVPRPVLSPVLAKGHGINVDVTAILGSMSDDFTRKLQQWEQIRTKPGHGIEYGVPASEGHQHSKTSPRKPSPREHRRHHHHHEPSTSILPADQIPERPSERPSTSTATMEEIQKNVTDSFNRKMQLWEKKKFKKEPSPEVEIRVSGKQKEERKPKKSKSEKDEEKFKRQRERDLLKVERDRRKLDRDKMRLDKERLRTLEKEAKIEKMRGRLSHSSVEHMKIHNPILGPLSEYKVTGDFARKLHEWEIIKGLSQEASTALYLEVQKRSLELAREMYGDTSFVPSHHHGSSLYMATARTPASGIDSDYQKPDLDHQTPPLTKKPSPLMLLRPSPLSSESPSPVEPEFREHPFREDGMKVDDIDGEDMREDSSCVTDETQESLTQTNIMRLEKANIHLVDELRKKEEEYVRTQLEVTALNEKLVKMKKRHTITLSNFKQELGAVAQNMPLAVDAVAVANSVAEMEHKIRELEKFGEKLTMSMEGAAICKFQNLEGEETVGSRLMDLVAQMKMMLVKVTHTEEASKRSSMLHDFQKLYSHAMQLQVQMNNLRLSHLERNKEIMAMKRQLLLQEVTNLLLQVDITRREAELLHYKDRRQKALRRSNTYSGFEYNMRAVEGAERDPNLPVQRCTSLKDNETRLDITSVITIPAKVAEELEKQDSQTKEEADGQHLSVSLLKKSRSSTASGDSADFSSLKSIDSESALEDPFSPAESMQEEAASFSLDTDSEQVDLVVSSPTLPISNIPLSLTPLPPISPPPPPLPLLPPPLKMVAAADAVPFSVSKDPSSPSSEHVLDQRLKEQAPHVIRIIGNGHDIPSVDHAALPPRSGISKLRLKTKPHTGIPIRSSKLKRAAHFSDPLVTHRAISLSVQHSPPKDLSHAEVQSVPKTDSPQTCRENGSLQSTTSQLPTTDPALSVLSILDRRRTKSESGEAILKHSVELIRRDPPKLPKLTLPPGLSKSLERPKLKKSKAVCENGGLSPVRHDSSFVIADRRFDNRPVREIAPVMSERTPVHKPVREIATLSPVIYPQPGCALITEPRSPTDTTVEFIRLQSTPPGRHSRQRIIPRQDRGIDSDSLSESSRSSKEITTSPKSTCMFPLTEQYSALKEQSSMTPSPLSPPKPIIDSASIKKIKEKHPVQSIVSVFEKQSSLDSVPPNPAPKLRPDIRPHGSVPLVGIVSPVRRLKPAAELLEESQRYRAGLPPKSAHQHLARFRGRSKSEESILDSKADKENVSEGYVRTLINQLSRENTPESKLWSSKSPPHRAVNNQFAQDSTVPWKGSCENVLNIVRRLSSPEHEVHRITLPSSPPRDLSNNGQVSRLTDVFSAADISQTSIDNDSVFESPKSHKSTPRTRKQHVSQHSHSLPSKPDSVVSLKTDSSKHSSLYFSETSSGLGMSVPTADLEIIPFPERSKSPKQKTVENLDNDGLRETTKCPTSPCFRRPFFPKKQGDRDPEQFSPKPPRKREKSAGGKPKQGTIGKLCQQAMTFDLGVSIQAVHPDKVEKIENRKSDPVYLHSRDGDDWAHKEPKPSSSEGHGSLSSGDEKQKGRAKFFEYSWFLKSRKLFKVSKC